MLRLFALRHAKSSWAEAGRKDFERGLNERGASDLPKIAAMMKERGYLPPQVYCSPALRARLTMHGVILAYSEAPRIDYVERLYSAGADAYVDSLRRHDKDEAVMFVGHNPSISEFVHLLIGGGDKPALEKLSRKYSTGALAVIEFDIEHWHDLAPGSGRLVDFIIPADL